MPGKGVLRMANWSDPRQSAAPYRTAAGIQTEAYDAGLRSYMLSVYNYMTSGVLLTGIIAMLFARGGVDSPRSEEHTSELQSLMRISYAVFCLKKKTR